MFSKKRIFLLSLISNLFFAFTLIVFGPYEIFISNTNDFTFTFRDFWWMPVSAAIVYIIVATLIMMILPQKISHICNNLVFSFTLCCYIQAMFLNGKMRVLIGEQIHWSNTTIIFNLLLWICVFIASFLLLYFSPEYWKKILLFCSNAFICMQAIALITLLISTNVLYEEKNGYISAEGMLELSENVNVIVFILDYFDGTTMNSILSKNPDFLQPLEGFTYFPNATSVYSRTYPSITYLLTGNMCYFDETPLIWVNDSFENSQFLPTLYNNQINVGLYTYDYYIGNNAKNHICNYVPSNLSLKYINTVKYMFKMLLYRDMPYIAKKRFEYDVNDINWNVTSSTRIEAAIKDTQESTMVPEYKNFDDEWFFTALDTQKINLSDSKGTFRFYHLGSCHLDLTNGEPYAIRSLEIVYEYLDQMRNLEIYENSTIIITADHGSSGGGDTLDLPQKTAVPLLIVKPAGTSTEKLTISDAPVSHTDFIPTILDGFSLDYSDYGQTVFDITETAQRDRYYYYSALFTNEDGEVELRKYKVSGNATDSNSYSFTGNTWDIIYSQNIVSD